MQKKWQKKCKKVAKKFGKGKMFDVSLHRFSERGQRPYRDVRDGREMVAFAFGKWIVKGPNHSASSEATNHD